MITLDAVATQIVGAPTRVECVASPLASNPNAAGWVWFTNGQAGHTIYLRKWICAGLANPESADAPAAFLSLTHEIIHVRNNDMDESRVECQALLNRWQVVRLFRLPARIARWLMSAEVEADARLTAPYHDEVCA